MVFLEIQNVTLWSVFQNPVTITHASVFIIKLNCHLVAFLKFEWTVQKVAKGQLNNTYMCNCSSSL